MWFCSRKLLFIILFIGFNFGCSRIQNSENANVFRYNESSGVLTLDPAFAKDLPHIWACSQLFNGLVSLDDKMNVVPAIAENWETDVEGLTYTFVLRTDVYFHENTVFGNRKRAVTANDFVFSFNRLIDPQLASPGAWIFNNVRQDDGRLAVFALNDTVLKIHLEKPFPAFIGLLSMVYASVVPHEAISFFGSDFRTNPVGTGPFRFKFWKEGVRLVLRRNPDYFETENGEKLPHLEAVSISFLIDKQMAFMEFIKGKIDFMSGIDARYKDELLNRDGKLRTKYQDRIELHRQPFMNTEYLGFFIGNSGGEPTIYQNKAFRKALNYAIDREKMLKYLRNNIGISGHGGMIPFGMPGFDSLNTNGYRFNPSLAEKIIKENGFEGESVTITTTADYIDLIKFVQSQLNAVGLDASIEVLPTATLREMRAKGQINFFRASWVADYPDAENYLSLFYSRNKTPAGPNYTHFSNENFDFQYDEMMKISNPEIRIQAYHKLDSLMMTEAPVVVLYYDEVLRFVSKRITDLGSNPTNNLDLTRVRIRTKM